MKSCKTRDPPLPLHHGTGLRPGVLPPRGCLTTRWPWIPGVLPRCPASGLRAAAAGPCPYGTHGGAMGTLAEVSSAGTPGKLCGAAAGPAPTAPSPLCAPPSCDGVMVWGSICILPLHYIGYSAPVLSDLYTPLLDSILIISCIN